MSAHDKRRSSWSGKSPPTAAGSFTVRLPRSHQTMFPCRTAGIFAAAREPPSSRTLGTKPLFVAVESGEASVLTRRWAAVSLVARHGARRLALAPHVPCAGVQRRALRIDTPRSSRNCGGISRAYKATGSPMLLLSGALCSLTSALSAPGVSPKQINCG